MRVFRPFAVVGVLMLLLLVGVINAEHTLRSTTTSAAGSTPLGEIGPMPPSRIPQEPVSGSDMNPKPSTQQTGAPAIQPHILGAGPTSPAFTAEDVRQYAARETEGFGPIQTRGAAPKILKVEFLTAAELRKAISKPLNLTTPDDTLLCYVQYSGDFFVHGPNGLPPTRYQRAAQVFDAHTGNLLMQTADERLP